MGVGEVDGCGRAEWMWAGGMGVGGWNGCGCAVAQGGTRKERGGRVGWARLEVNDCVVCEAVRLEDVLVKSSWGRGWAELGVLTEVGGAWVGGGGRSGALNGVAAGQNIGSTMHQSTCGPECVKHPRNTFVFVCCSPEQTRVFLHTTIHSHVCVFQSKIKSSLPTPSSDYLGSIILDSTDQHGKTHVFDLNCKICQGDAKFLS